MNNDPLGLAHDLQMDDAYNQTRNHPPEGDTTSEGGPGTPNTFNSECPSTQPRTDKAPTQQTEPTATDPGPTLIDQSPDGGPLSSELQDAQQGSDRRAREAFAHAAQRDFEVGSPYGRHPDPDSDSDFGGERGASAYADARGRQFESGPAGAAGEDVGAF